MKQLGETKIELERKKKEATITGIAGFDSIEAVRSVYPKQFDETVLDKLPAKLDLGSATSPLDRYTWQGNFIRVEGH